ncbi:hypothetical protein C453_04079 [Haloferax elongans ATCC BAA-1513]|uniref:Uncharacterized protein n=1 Tax=Haloferax elongans ATCC BAA-1513 TaxID=1230453 RepID=M0HSE7_HALEO|nr:hypothetical protein [Haloferax elongans]ELZ87500.1 hypothetical protein C453_04079 [Haloferax elongans ATCC BAA-1513]
MSDEDDQKFREIIQYRSDIYDSLATDSLSILNIQLFTIPLTVSIITLVFKAVENTEKANGQEIRVFAALAEKLNTELTLYAVIGMLVGIVLSSFSYYTARRRASAQVKYVDQRFSEKDAKDWLIKSAHDWYVQTFEDHIVTSKDHSDIINNTGENNIPGEVLRVALGTSVFVTLSSLAVIFNQVFSIVYEQITEVLLLLGSLTLILLMYTQYAIVIILIVEKLLGKVSRFTQTIFSFFNI